MTHVTLSQCPHSVSFCADRTAEITADEDEL
jgi:hypothetical protein